MSRTEELICKSQAGDNKARELLVTENTGLIWAVVRRFIGRGTEADDLFQLGCVGFLKAVDGFDLSFGTQFSTYAVPKIAGEIRRFLRDDSTVKVSRGLKERAILIRAVTDKLEQELGRPPQLTEIGAAAELTPEEVAEAMSATGRAESLQRETTEDGFSLEQVLSDGNQEERLVEGIALRSAITKLPEKEQMVIRLRYFRGMTQDAAAKILKVSQVQVSRLERRAIEKLREVLS